jgi:hypothetical protein
MSAISQKRQLKSKENVGGLFKNFPYGHPVRSRIYDENIENLRTVIEYLTHLRNIDKLSDKEFSTLITQACAKFVENELDLIINNVLSKAFKDLKKILEEYKNAW